MRGLKNSLCLWQKWLKIAGPINCPAPLPEDPAPALLEKLLAPAPYVVPGKKVKKKKTTGTRKSARNVVVSSSSSGESATPSSRENEKEEQGIPPPPTGEGKKRKAAPAGAATGSKKRKTPTPDYSPDPYEDEEERPERTKRPATS